ncbi:hypothetical protein ACTFIZ_006775 [Dictyostelium cf. discoideum]
MSQKILTTTHYLYLNSIHRFYLNRPCSGVLYLFTCGCFFIGWFIDICLIPGMVEDYNAKYDSMNKSTTTTVTQVVVQPVYQSSPQQSYGAPPQQPYGAPPQQPYGAPPQQPYGAPPQQPYGAPPQQPYGAPPGAYVPQGNYPPPYTPQ